MAQIHYFPRYSQRENFETNNTLLLLHQIYNYNRFRFEKCLSALLREANAEASNMVELGLQIRQQIGTGASIVDGYLYQDNLRIAIETKRGADYFNSDQLTRHLNGFIQSSGGFLILLSPERAPVNGPRWERLINDATARNVTLLSVSFEDIISAARGCLADYDEQMHALVADYEDFCSSEGLLPIDKWTLFVPPCGQSHEINITQKLYFCPASWSRRKARYLGIYYDKAVRYVGAIAKVVECELTDGNVTEATSPLTNEERDRIIGASELARERNGWDLTTGHQFFLCDQLVDTMFSKTSSGGIMGHRYFDLRDYLSGGVPSELSTVAERLRDHNWQ